MVVVDEAYFEYTGRTVIPWRARYPHLIVVRTLSKAFALPGIRVGWAVAARPTIARLERVRPGRQHLHDLGGARRGRPGSAR